MVEYVTLNGNIYSDGATDEGGAVKNLANGGHRENFLPLLQDFIADSGRVTRTTSASSVEIGSGTKTFVLAQDTPFRAPEWVLVVDSANAANYMYGRVSTYTSPTRTLVLTVESADVYGSGTITSWNVLAVGAKGNTGAAGLDGADGLDGAPAFSFAVASGTANAITATYNMQALTVGQPLAFRATATNTGAATFNPDSLGALQIQYKGANLTGGELISGGIYEVRYDGALYQLTSAPSNFAVEQDSILYSLIFS